MVHFVGAGPGAPDLITLRGAALLKQADVILYTGSLVNPALLRRKKAPVQSVSSPRNWKRPSMSPVRSHK